MSILCDPNPSSNFSTKHGYDMRWIIKRKKKHLSKYCIRSSSPQTLNIYPLATSQMDFNSLTISDGPLPNATNSPFSDLMDEIAKLHSTIASQAKYQRLEWAIDHSQIGYFEYYTKYNGSIPGNSSEFVKGILLNFRIRHGTYIEKRSTLNYSNINVLQEQEGKRRFRKKLFDQIRMLMGRKPEIDIQGDRWIICYGSDS